MKKRGVKHPMADVAINMASKRANDEIDKHLKGGRRMRVNGVGTSGIRISGSGHCGMGLDILGLRQGDVYFCAGPDHPGPTPPLPAPLSTYRRPHAAAWSVYPPEPADSSETWFGSSA